MNLYKTSLFCALAATAMVRPVYAQEDAPTRILFTNVNIFDGVNEELAMGMSVLVEDNLIREVATAIPAPAGATIIDGGARTLMPGLIDSHVHLTHMTVAGLEAWEGMTWDEMAAEAMRNAREFLMSGFTTVRDMGGTGPGIKRAVDRGLGLGPRIYPAGPYLSQTSGHGDLRGMSVPNAQLYGGPQTNLERLGLVRLADGVPNVLLATREALATGSVYLKLMAGGGISSTKDPLHTFQYTEEEVAAAVEVAGHWDTYVAVHVYGAEQLKRALRSGVMCIDHGHFIDEEGFELLEETGAFLSTNLAAMSPEILEHPIYGNPDIPQGVKTLQFLEESANFVELAKRHRPKMVFQTDVVTSPIIVARGVRDHSMYLHADWFGNYEALKAMTSVPGELAALTGKGNPYPGKLGVIEPGAYADIILVDGNPLEDMSVLGAAPKLFEAAPRGETIDTIHFIMKDGVIFKNVVQ